MRMRILCALLLAIFLFGTVASLHAAPLSKTGQHMKMMEEKKAKKQKELKNLEKLEEIVGNQVASAKAEMAKNMMSTMEKVGRVKTDPNGLVMTGGGIMHSPSKRWKLNVQRLRKEYENAGIYTPDEINDIVDFHQSYVENQGFTAGISEQLAKVAEAKAQQRTIQKYIARKIKEIEELESALNGLSSGGGGSGSGGGGDGY